MLKQINILGLRCRKLRTFPGKFLNFGKSAGVKDMTNIMSGTMSYRKYTVEALSPSSQYIYIIHFAFNLYLTL